MVLYDISSNKERRRIRKLLKGYGFKIQKSVFECKLNRKWKLQMISRLESLEIKTGFIKIYKLDYSSKDKIIGEKEKPSIDDENAFII